MYRTTAEDLEHAPKSPPVRWPDLSKRVAVIVNHTITCQAIARRPPLARWLRLFLVTHLVDQWSSSCLLAQMMVRWLHWRLAFLAASRVQSGASLAPNSIKSLARLPAKWVDHWYDWWAGAGRCLDLSFEIRYEPWSLVGWRRRIGTKFI